MSSADAAYTVLLAEDEEVLRQITALVLRRAGYKVLEAGTTDAAREVAVQSKSPVDVLIADLGLPGTGGVPLFRELVKVDPEMKGVFISGYSLDAVSDVAQLPHGTAFLGKPFEHETLLKTVRQLLAR